MKDLMKLLKHLSHKYCISIAIFHKEDSLERVHVVPFCEGDPVVTASSSVK